MVAMMRTSFRTFAESKAKLPAPWTQALRTARRRLAHPTMVNPASINAHEAGSGTVGINAAGSAENAPPDSASNVWIAVEEPSWESVGVIDVRLIEKSFSRELSNSMKSDE